jgi:hypothetical protein
MKTHFKTKTSVMIAMLMALLSCISFTQEDKTPTITKTFDMDQPGTLITSSSGGGICIKSHDQKKVVVQVFIRKNGRLLPPSSPSIDDVLEGYDLEVEKNGSVIIANANRKKFIPPWKNTGIYFTVIVPREMSCDASSSGGKVTVTGVKGTHDISSSGGSVKLENLTGTIKAKSSGGGVKMENLSGTVEARSSGGGVKAVNMDGDIHLTSSGGPVNLDKAKGSVFAKSSGGGVHLNNIHGDVNAESSGGGVDIEGEAGYVKAKSSGGSVHVNISNLNKEMYLESSGGGIKAVIRNGKNLGLDLDLSSDKVNIELNNFSGRAEKDRVSGTMNNGGIPVYMRSSGGNVNVLFEE